VTGAETGEGAGMTVITKIAERS